MGCRYYYHRSGVHFHYAGSKQVRQRRINKYNAMIVNEISTLKHYLPTITLNSSFSMFSDYLQVAEDYITDRILGEDLRVIIEGNPDKSSPHRPLAILVERTICNMAFLQSIPDLDLVLTEQGFAVTNSTAYSPASRQRVEKLLQNITLKTDAACDALVSFLVRCEKYESWRGTRQFEYLSTALIYTYTEFCQHIPITEKSPRNWKEFYNCIPDLYTALCEVVSPYLSQDYVDELIEKVRDKEIIKKTEIEVLKLVKDAICLQVSGRQEQAHEKTLTALKKVKKDIDLFPTFAISEEAKSIDIPREDSPIYSMLG